MSLLFPIWHAASELKHYPDKYYFRGAGYTAPLFYASFENAFGRLDPRLTRGTTTVMTGNTTMASVAFIQGITARPRDREKMLLSKHILIMAGVFLAGCICGGFLAGRFGLAVIALPGVAVLGVTIGGNKKN